MPKYKVSSQNHGFNFKSMKPKYQMILARCTLRSCLLRYCCLLANPQNLDIGQLLSGPPKESPFAKAMRCASHVLVIPNETVSIYTRLLLLVSAAGVSPVLGSLQSACRLMSRAFHR